VPGQAVYYTILYYIVHIGGTGAKAFCLGGQLGQAATGKSDCQSKLVRAKL